MVEQLFPLDSAGEGWVHSSYAESPEEAAAVGDLAFCQQVLLSGSCKYLQPSPKCLKWELVSIRSCACCNVWPVTINYLFTSHARVSTWPSTEKFIPFNRENLNYLTRKKKSHWKSWTLKTSEKGFSWLKQWVVTAFSEFIVPVSGFLWRISLRSYSK